MRPTRARTKRLDPPSRSASPIEGSTKRPAVGGRGQGQTGDIETDPTTAPLPGPDAVSAAPVTRTGQGAAKSIHNPDNGNHHIDPTPAPGKGSDVGTIVDAIPTVETVTPAATISADDAHGNTLTTTGSHDTAEHTPAPASLPAESEDGSQKFPRIVPSKPGSDTVLVYLHSRSPSPLSYHDLPDPKAFNQVANCAYRYRISADVAPREGEQREATRLFYDHAREQLGSAPSIRWPEATGHDASTSFVELQYDDVPTFHRARHLTLSWKDHPYTLAFTGAALPKDYVVMKIQNLPGNTLLGDFMTHCINTFSRTLNLTNYWAEFFDSKAARLFSGTVTFLWQYKNESVRPIDIPGWIRFESMLLTVYYTGRINLCTYCKLRGGGRHTIGNCTRRRCRRCGKAGQRECWGSNGGCAGLKGSPSAK